MSTELGEFFSLIGKARQEKEEEFQSLVGEINIDSLFAEVKTSVAEDKKKKKKKLAEDKKKKAKEKRQVKALESWLYSEPKQEEKLEIEDANGDVAFEVVDLITPEPLKPSEPVVEEQEEPEEISEEVEEIPEDTVDHALKILETIKSKEEVQENVGDPEIIKIRGELEYLKNLVNAQGGGGEVRLEFLDDVDRDTAKVDGKFLKYQSSTGKWIGADASGADSEEASKLVLDARNNNVGYAITIGTPVYQTGYNSGQDRINIEEARASDSTTMPAKGVTTTDLDNNTNGQILVYGELEGVDTSAFDVADELYVAPGGGLTNTRPTDPGHLVQKIAVVLKKSASNGAILVYGAGRTNDVPNTISIAGSITASTYYGDGSNLTGVGSTDNIITGTAATFTGNVNVSGATTFSNAVTIDSSNYLQLNDSTNIIGHNGANNLFRFTDSLQFRGNSMFFQEYDGTEYLRMNSTTGLTLKRDGNTKLQIETDGITVTGTINDHTIPSGSGTFALTSDVPTNNNELTNGAGYITTSFTNTNQLTNGAGFITTSFTNTNQLTNGAGFVTFTNNNQLTNGAGYITTSFTNTNQLTNGAGFITASDNITGTSAGLSGSPNISVGSITATSGEFSGNVTIGGTLTYEDVTSIDSVGLVTARLGIDVNGGQLIVGSAFSVGQAGIVTASGFVGSLTGSASSLSGVSSSFLLDYNNFTNTPTIPTNNNQLTNGAGFVTFTNNNQLTNGAGYITTSFTNTNQLTNGAGFITASDDITGTAAGISGTPNIVVGITTVQRLSGFKSLVGSASSTTETFVTTVDSKTTNHRYHGSGSSSAYFLDEIESPFLTLLPGKTYRFDQSDSSNSGHPLRFYLEADKTTAYTTNVTTNGTAGSSGAYTEILVTDSTPLVLHYQCSSHGYMGNSSFLNSNLVDTPYQITARSGINVSGIVTATSFVGNITGNVTGNADTATSATSASTATTATNAQGLTGTPNITVGIITASSAEFSGNVTIGGTLTYEDVTNIDSVGIVTARTGVDITGGEITVGAAFSVGQAGVVTANSYYGDGSNLTGVASTDFIITGTAATFNNVVRVGTGITLDASSGIITATDFVGINSGGVSFLTATETLANKTLRNPTFESGANSPEFLETRYVNATQQDFVQLYTGGSSGTYFTQGEYQKIATITPSGDHQNYTFNIRLTATSASNYQIVNFTGGLRANTLPDLDFTVNFSEEHNGVRFIEPKLWTKETTTAGFILAFEYVHSSSLFGGVNVEATIIPRSSDQRANVAFNTTQNSEQSSIDTGFTERDPTLTLSTVNGIPIFGTQFQIEGSTDNGFETTITTVDATADRTITFPDSSGTVALLGDGVMSDLADDTTPQLGGNLDLNSKDITGTGNINVSGAASVSTLNVAGVSTLPAISGQNINVSGIVTANAFIGDGTGLTGVGGGSVISGITIREEGSTVGTAGTVVSVNFVGDNITATASGAAATITASSTPTFDSVSVGVATVSSALYVPKYTTTARDAATFGEGAIIFNTTTKKMNFYDGTNWIELPGVTLGLGMGVF